MTWYHPLACLLILLLAVGAGFIGTFLWRRKKREGKYPLPEDLKVLRTPGECLKRELSRLDEQFFYAYIVAVVLPIFLGSLPLWVRHWKSDAWAWGILIACVALAAVGLILGIGWMVRLTEKMRDVKLGLFGERVVADQLEALRGKGFAVFHDVPCQGGSGPFNIDHVAVGHGAVAVIETKTRRKRSGKNSEKAYEVTFDGKQLIWPGWESDSEIQQVLRNGEWLSKRLKEKLNLSPAVHPFLAIPGWMVKSRLGFSVSVQNPKSLPGAILNICRGSLSATEEDLIVRHLRDLCQDVDYEQI